MDCNLTKMGDSRCFQQALHECTNFLFDKCIPIGAKSPIASSISKASKKVKWLIQGCKSSISGLNHLMTNIEEPQDSMYNSKCTLHWTALQANLKSVQKCPLKWIINEADHMVMICIEQSRNRKSMSLQLTWLDRRKFERSMILNIGMAHLTTYYQICYTNILHKC